MRRRARRQTAPPAVAGIPVAGLATPWAAALLLGEALIRSGARRWGLVAALDLLHPWWYAPALPLALLALLGRRWGRLALLAGGCAIWLASYGGRWLPPEPQPAAGPILRVLTWNVAGWNLDAADIDRVISREQPDIILLQEVDAGLVKPLRARLAGRYPHSYAREPTAPGLQPADLAMWSRYPFAGSPLDCPYWECYRRAATVAIAGRDLTVINVHIEHSPLFAAPDGRAWLPLGAGREREDRAIERLLADSAGWDGPLLIAGDFNTTERQDGYARLAGRWRDSWRERGRGLGATWPRTVLSPPLLRIDYLWHSDELAASRAVLGSGRSDHRYLVVDLVWR